MRRIDPAPPSSEVWRRWIEDCETATADLLKRVEQGRRPVFDRRIYGRRTVRSQHFFHPEGPFFGKCAYCETAIVGFQHGDLDHFRPKAAVTDAQDRPVYLRNADGTVKTTDGGEPLPHPGYYWLAYDFRNLLPSCQTCNQPSTFRGLSFGKRNRFPVRGRRAQAPGETSEEEPMLIHPTRDDPEEHLSVETSTGLLIPKTDRGSVTLEVFGLNLRDRLVEERLKACDQVAQLLFRARVLGRESAKRKLRDIEAGRHPYSLAQRAALARG